MINTGDISQLAVLLSILNVPTGGGGGGSVTQSEVQRSAFNYAPATGVDDAFVVTLNPAPGSLTNGLLITMTSGSLENTTNSPTLKVNTIAAKPIILWAGGLAPGDIQANGAYIFVYSTQEDSFYLINPSVSTANSFLTQSNAYNSFVDAGAADAYVGTLSIQSDASLSSGFTVLMQASAANTGASTLTINGDTLPIVFEGGTSLTAGVIVANQIYSLIYSLTFDSWVLLNPKNTSTVLTLADNSNTLPDSFSLGSLSNGLLKIDVSSSIATVSNAINSTDFWAPGDVITLPGLPLNSNDAASKGYVDTVASGFSVIASCVAATTVDFSSTYNNGASGVGATLTALVNGAAGNVDGVAMVLNNRVLFKDQTTTSQNGVYTLTTVGTGATPAVYTRATDFDTAADITPGELVPILGGTINIGSIWLQTETVVTVGTDAILFTVFVLPSNSFVTLATTQTIAGAKTFTLPPVITQINDTNGATAITFPTVASAVNFVEVLAAAAGSRPSISAVGTDANIGLSIVGKGTGGVRILGTGTNDSASPGYVGQYISSKVVRAAGITLTTSITANLTTISLTAGDWDVGGNTVFENTAGAMTITQSSTNQASLNLGGLEDRSYLDTSGTYIIRGSNVPTSRVSLSAPATMFLVVAAHFSSGTTKVSGNLFARRVR